jgi:hypothetical protein
MYPVPIGSGLGEIRGLTFFCAGSDANMAEYRAYIMDKDGLISRAIGLVCPDDETAMEYAKARLRGGPRTSQAQCPRLIAPTPDGSALMILRRYCTALDRMPDGAWAPRGRAPRRNRACRTSFQGSEIEPLA